MNSEILVVVVLATLGLLPSNEARAAGRAETAATLACVPSLPAGAVATVNCLQRTHTALEISQCLRIQKGSCFGKSNEIRKVLERARKPVRKFKRWLRKRF